MRVEYESLVKFTNCVELKKKNGFESIPTVLIGFESIPKKQTCFFGRLKICFNVNLSFYISNFTLYL